MIDGESHIEIEVPPLPFLSVDATADEMKPTEFCALGVHETPGFDRNQASFRNSKLQDFLGII